MKNFLQKDSERKKLYKKKKLETKRSQEALIWAQGFMEIVEDLCVVMTPDKRKRLVESQSTPVEIAATTAYVNNLSPQLSMIPCIITILPYQNY